MIIRLPRQKLKLYYDSGFDNGRDVGFTEGYNQAVEEIRAAQSSMTSTGLALYWSYMPFKLPITYEMFIRGNLT